MELNQTVFVCGVCVCICVYDVAIQLKCSHTDEMMQYRNMTMYNENERDMRAN